MRFVVLFIITLAAAVLANVLNPFLRVSPIEVYGMQLSHRAGDLGAIVISAFLVKLLLLTVVGYGRFTRAQGWEAIFVRVSMSSIAISAVAILLFIFTAIPSSPNFLILFCVIDALLFSLSGKLTNRHQTEHANTSRRLLSRRRFFLTAILAGGVPLSLAVLAWSYKQWPEMKRGANLVQNQFGSRGDFFLEDIWDDLKFRQLIDFAVAPETGEIFVLERGGRIYRVNPETNEAILAVDFSEAVGREPVDELGAYSLTLHPNFETGADERLFVFHTSRTREKSTNILVEFDLESRGKRKVLEIPATGSSHNSGSLAFDPEGFLFIGLGDAERKLDSQDPGNLFGGKILRIDPDKSGGNRSRPPNRPANEGIVRDYFIPHSNPFPNSAEIQGEIWSIGLRNPFRLRWEPRLQALLTGDVGQLRWEELNLFRGGDNGGWPAREGAAIYEEPESPLVESDRFQTRTPFFSYPHDALNRAIVCGPLYERTRYPDLTGKVVYGDNFSGRIWAIPPDGSEPPKLLARAPDFNQSGISRIAPGPNGEIWVAVMGAQSEKTGTIYRLIRQQNRNSSPAISTRAPAEIFALQCAFCHGADGRGNGPTANEFPVKPADFSDPAWQKTVDDKTLRQVIQDGGTGAGKTASMPAWKEILTEKEIDGLVEHIRGLAK